MQPAPAKTAEKAENYIKECPIKATIGKTVKCAFQNDPKFQKLQGFLLQNNSQACGMKLKVWEVYDLILSVPYRTNV